jgi:hypothetical protein
LDLLLRDLQAHSAAITFSDLAPLAHQLEQHQNLAGPTAIDLSLRLSIAQLSPAANLGSRHLRRHRLTAMVELIVHNRAVGLRSVASWPPLR